MTTDHRHEAEIHRELAGQVIGHEGTMEHLGLAQFHALLAIHDTLTAADRYAANEERQREEAAMTTRDEYHTLDELYEYRMLYNALAANAMPDRAVKSWRHSDGEQCFGGGWFVVYLDLPTGQVSNHYQAEHWGLFQVPEADIPEWDGHTPAEAADRLRRALAQDEAKQREASEPDPLDEDDHTICQCGDCHGYCECGTVEECRPDSDPLDEDDHRDRLDPDGDRVGGDCHVTLTYISEGYGPLTFAPGPPPDGTGDDLATSEGESGSVEGEGADDAWEALLCPECGHGLHSHTAAIGCRNPFEAPDCGCENTATDVARDLIAEAVKAERLRLTREVRELAPRVMGNSRTLTDLAERWEQQ